MCFLPVQCVNKALNTGWFSSLSDPASVRGFHSLRGAAKPRNATFYYFQWDLVKEQSAMLSVVVNSLGWIRDFPRSCL